MTKISKTTGVEALHGNQAVLDVVVRSLKQQRRPRQRRPDPYGSPLHVFEPEEVFKVEVEKMGKDYSKDSLRDKVERFIASRKGIQVSSRQICSAFGLAVTDYSGRRIVDKALQRLCTPVDPIKTPGRRWLCGVPRERTRKIPLSPVAQVASLLEGKKTAATVSKERQLFEIVIKVGIRHLT